MTKLDLLGVYRTLLNHIQLTYASLILWSYPDTSAFFEKLYEQMPDIPRPFQDVLALVHDDRAMRIACEELYDSAHRAAIVELLPLTKAYFNSIGHLAELKEQPWYQFWRILRNYFAHDMTFCFSKDEKALLPITWSGVTIDLSMNGTSLKHGQCSRDKFRELLETAETFVKNHAA